jgi:hypothetical protein
MKAFSSVGLVTLLLAQVVGCSNEEAGSEVNRGTDSGGGAVNVGGTGDTAGSGGMGATGAALNLGGGLTNDEGGAPGEDPMPDLPSEVNVIITADNAYGFGYGTKTRLENYFGGVENPSASDIFDCPVGSGPESYVVPAADANAGGFLYIIGYADKSTTQGVIAKFYREGAEPIYTGMGKWEVCATGEDYDPGSGGPTRETIDAYIAKCNDGDLDAATSSVGWVDATGNDHGKLVFGEDNSTPRDAPLPGNEFLVACEVEADARWMWFDWEPQRAEGSPFMWPGQSENTTKDFLIFRLGADQVPVRPPK